MRFVQEGRRYAAAVLALGLAPTIVVPPVGILVVMLAGSLLWFFRDPYRDPPEAGVVAPADGRVQVRRQEGDRVRVGIFMNVTDVHVNRSPVPGTIIERRHRAGGYWPAFSKASDRNERVDIVLETAGGEYVVSLIAGTVARRIRPYVEAGDRVARGERIGHIAFGSRVDILLPRRIGINEVTVTPGDRVTAGETIIVPRDEDSGDGRGT